MQEPVEICNHCGRKVSWGSGSFANRVPDCNDVRTRIINGLHYPFGDFVCADCDSRTTDDEYDEFPTFSVN
jgi:hypothetical protein